MYNFPHQNFQTSNQAYGAHAAKNISRSEVKDMNAPDSLTRSTLKRLSQSNIVSPKNQQLFQSMIYQSQSPMNQSLLNKNSLGNGLANIGQTCYMNSVLQCLFHVAGGKLINQIEEQLQNAESFKPAHELLFLLSLTKNISQNQIANYEQMCQVKDIVDEFATNFRGTAQQCAHEFFCKIRELIHDCLNRNNPTKSKIQQINNTPSSNTSNIIQKCQDKWNQVNQIESSLISDYFRGQFLKLMQCKNNKCLKQSVLCDVFDDLQLHIPTSERRSSYLNIFPSSQEDKLSDYLRFEFRKEVLQEAACESCKSKGMDLQSYLIRIPTIFVSQIVRFDSQNNKKHNKIFIPSKLDLSEYIFPTEKTKLKSTKYKLTGIIDHHGETLFKGHYTSSIYNKNDNNWYLFNDDQVTKLENNYEYQLEFHGSSTAYILFYELI